MNRAKTFDATGIAPGGYLYAGDLNQIQDLVAALADFGQLIQLGTLEIGETGLALLHYGSLEARLTGKLRLDSDLRVGGVLYPLNGIVFPDASIQTTATPANSSGHFIGEIIEWPSLTLPSFGSEVWAWPDGSAVSRATYATFLATTTVAQNGTRTSGSQIITGLSSTAGMAAGQSVEGAGIPTSTTITSVDSLSQIHISQNASSSGTNTFTVFPFGNGDGSTTFNIIDKRGRVTVALVMASGHADVAGMGLNEGVALANRRPKHNQTNSTTLPAHIHNYTDPGHNHSKNDKGGQTGAASSVNVVDSNADATAAPITAPATTGLVMGNPTTNPPIGGTIGPSGTNPVDAPAYIVIPNAIRLK